MARRTLSTSEIQAGGPKGLELLNAADAVENAQRNYEQVRRHLADLRDEVGSARSDRDKLIWELHRGTTFEHVIWLGEGEDPEESNIESPWSLERVASFAGMSRQAVHKVVHKLDASPREPAFAIDLDDDRGGAPDDEERWLNG